MPGPLFPIQNFVAKPYAGSLQGVNVSLLTRGGITTNDGQTVQPGQQSRTVNATIDFLSTNYTGQAVTISLQSVANTPALNKILMVYVDNELNSQDVTILFPDSQQYVGVPAFTTGYYPVLTGQLQCTVYNGTTGKVPITAASQVSIIFCNFAIPGFLSQETLNITVNSSSGPVVPTIGDTVQTTPLVQSDANPFTMLTTLTAPEQYVITAIEVNATNLFVDGSNPASIGPFILTLKLFDPAIGTPIRAFNIAVRAEFEGKAFFNICDETGLNIPVHTLDAGFFVGPNSNTPVEIPLWSCVTVSVTYATVSL
jgi:hypothetical protein